jgi:hypothetical protein
MALRRRIGISTATTEAARRQLMQPVPCWEKVWVVPEKAAPGSTLKVLKWVKTDKVQVGLSPDDAEKRTFSMTRWVYSNSVTMKGMSMSR